MTNNDSALQLQQSFNDLLYGLFNDIEPSLTNNKGVNYTALINDKCEQDCRPCRNYTHLEIGINNFNKSFDEIKLDIYDLLNSSNYLPQINDFFNEDKVLGSNISIKNYKEFENNDLLNLDSIIKTITRFDYSNKQYSPPSYQHIIGGSKIRNQDDLADPGTLGIVCKDLNKDVYYILSAKHVLYPNGHDKKSIIINLNNKAVHFAQNFLNEREYNSIKKLDFAISKIKPEYNSYIKKGIINFGDVPDTFPVAHNCDMVVKYGYSSDSTDGYIRSIKCDMSYSIYSLTDTILISNYSESGDSGSVILKKDTNELIGLLVGGNRDSYTFAINIEKIIASLYNIGIKIIFNF